MAGGKPAFSGDVRHADAAMHVLMKDFRRSSLLPRRQSSLGMARRLLEYAVALDEMRTEDEAELIEGKHRRSVAAAEKRKNTLRDLRHNQIIFEHCQAIVIHTAEAEILGDVIESLTRNRIMNIIESATCPAHWL